MIAVAMVKCSIGGLFHLSIMFIPTSLLPIFRPFVKTVVVRRVINFVDI